MKTDSTIIDKHMCVKKSDREIEHISKRSLQMQERVKLFLADGFRTLREFIKGNIWILFGDKHLYKTAKIVNCFSWYWKLMNIPQVSRTFRQFMYLTSYISWSNK